MAIKRQAPAQENSNNELLPEGEYEGRLAYVADLGLLKREFKGEAKPPAQQIAVGIEILGKTRTFEGVESPLIMWDNGFNIFSTMTEKGTELKRYAVFKPSAKEGEVADWDAVLGMPCNVTVVHNATGEYANIDNLQPIPTKYQKDVEPMATSDACTGDIGDENNPAQKALYGLPRWKIENLGVGTNDSSSDADYT
jgi:hypothetical protein